MARFMRKGITELYFVPTISNPAAPTVAEITAGTDLEDQLAEINGFSFSNSPIDTPDMGDAFVSKIPGEDTVDSSDMTFYEDDTSNPIKTALAKGTTGYVAIFYAGLVTADTPAIGDKCDVWPCQVASNSRMYTADNEAAKYQVVFTLTDSPSIESTLT